MDYIYLKGIDLISYLQTKFPGKGELLMELTFVGDSRQAFMVFFPIAMHLDPTTGIKLLWATAMAEWINTILKWFLHGERPYWWLQETTHYTNANRPKLTQYRLTCETGPGGPSGHTMLAACLGHMLCLAMQEKDTEAATAAAADAGDDNISAYRSNTMIVVWVTYVIYVFLVCFSRIYIGSHFPHQAIAGVILGVLVSNQIQGMDTDNIPLTMYYLVAMLILASGFVLYSLIYLLGHDPMWSLAMARKRCANAHWVTINTTLPFSLSRASGILIGTGAGLWLMQQPEEAAINVDDTSLHRWITIIVCLLVSQGSEVFVPYPNPEAPNVYYLHSLARHCVLMLLIVAAVPMMLMPVLRALF